VNRLALLPSDLELTFKRFGRSNLVDVQGPSG